MNSFNDLWQSKCIIYLQNIYEIGYTLSIDTFRQKLINIFALERSYLNNCWNLECVAAGCLMLSSGRFAYNYSKIGIIVFNLLASCWFLLIIFYYRERFYHNQNNDPFKAVRLYILELIDFIHFNFPGSTFRYSCSGFWTNLRLFASFSRLHFCGIERLFSTTVFRTFQ